MEERRGFSKKNRIVRQADFKRIIASGEKLKSNGILIYVTEGNKRKFGVSVSKKIRTAVKRNRYKRIIREYFRNNQNKFSEKINIIVVVLKEIPETSFLNISQMLENCFRAAQNVAKHD